MSIPWVSLRSSRTLTMLPLHRGMSSAASRTISSVRAGRKQERGFPRRTDLTVFLETLRILLMSRIGTSFSLRVIIASLVSSPIMTVPPFDLFLQYGEEGSGFMEDYP